MGYRSEVRCLIYGAADQIDALVAQQVLKGNPWFSGPRAGQVKRHENVCAYYPGDVGKEGLVDVLDLYFKDISWYDDFEEVSAWMDMLADIKMGKIPFAVTYEFLRIGEENNDIECNRGSANDQAPIEQCWLYASTPRVVCDMPRTMKVED